MTLLLTIMIMMVSSEQVLARSVSSRAYRLFLPEGGERRDARAANQRPRGLAD
jgi:hypothetical protein